MFTTALTAFLTSSVSSRHVTLVLCIEFGFLDAGNLQCDRVSHGRAKQTGLSFPFCRHHLYLMFFFFFGFVFSCHRVIAANDGGGCSVDNVAQRALACAPSLNSPRSNLQTAAEFWQILPRCFLPLGDTFFIYFFFSSALVFSPWSTGPASYCQFCSPSMSKKPNGFTGFTVNPSLYEYLIFITSSNLWRHSHYSSEEELLWVSSTSLFCCDFDK